MPAIDAPAHGLGQSRPRIIPNGRRDAPILPQRALGSDGRSIALLWTNTVAFQQLQRLAHGDIALETYLDFVRGQRGDDAARACASMPATRRFSISVPAASSTEEKLSGDSEWAAPGAGICRA